MAIWFVSNIKPALLCFDAKAGNVEPLLATSWKWVDDRTLELKLRQDVKFHDGSDFTAADVAFSIERPAILNSPGGFTIFTRAIEPVVASEPRPPGGAIMPTATTASSLTWSTKTRPRHRKRRVPA